MDKRRRSLFSVSALVMLAGLFIVLTMLSNTALRGARLDLTENNLYTLTQGSKNILAAIEEPVNLYFYFSEQASRDLPQVRNYAERVDELLTEFSERAAGQVRVQRIDPAPFSEAEDQAAQYGLQSVPVGASGDNLYFGIAATNSLDDIEVLPFLDPRKEQFLEYDLAKMVYTLSQASKPRVGWLSSLPLEGGIDPVSQRPREAAFIYQQLSQLFDLQTVATDASGLPVDLDLLVVVHPKNLSDDLLYAIDQFVLTGGRLVAFMDPHAQMDSGAANPNDPLAQVNAGGSSSLGKLLQSWGVDFTNSEIIGDLQYALQVGMPGGGTTRHAAILGVSASGLNRTDITTAELETVNLVSAGYLRPLAEATTSFEALIQSSENAMPIAASRLRFLPNPAELLNGFQATGERYVLAARITGPATSAFPERGGEVEQSSATGINILLFADVDFLADQYWVQKQAFFGQSLATAFADNGTLVINALENMLGNSDLISIRARATSARPFSKVDRLRVQAEQEFLETEQRLQLELQETERKLNELQNNRQDSNLAVMTDAQRAELNRFEDQRLQIRRDLRQVRRNLDQEIKALGTRIKIINIVLVPLLIALLGLLFFWRNRQRSKESVHGR